METSFQSSISQEDNNSTFDDGGSSGDEVEVRLCSSFCLTLGTLGSCQGNSAESCPLSPATVSRPRICQGAVFSPVKARQPPLQTTQIPPPSNPTISPFLPPSVEVRHADASALKELESVRLLVRGMEGRLASREEELLGLISRVRRPPLPTLHQAATARAYLADRFLRSDGCAG